MSATSPLGQAIFCADQVDWQKAQAAAAALQAARRIGDAGMLTGLVVFAAMIAWLASFSMILFKPDEPLWGPLAGLVSAVLADKMLMGGEGTRGRDKRSGWAWAGGVILGLAAVGFQAPAWSFDLLMMLALPAVWGAWRLIYGCLTLIQFGREAQAELAWAGACWNRALASMGGQASARQLDPGCVEAQALHWFEQGWASSGASSQQGPWWEMANRWRQRGWVQAPLALERMDEEEFRALAPRWAPKAWAAFEEREQLGECSRRAPPRKEVRL